MANVINAQNGIASTADSTSELNIQTGGVTAIGIGTGQTANITTLTGTSATITTILDGVGNVRNIPSAGSAKTSNYTLAITDIGEFVTIGTSGAITVPNDVFAAGNAVSIFNNTTGNAIMSLTITTGYLAGTDADKAFVTLSTRGVATVLFVNPSLCVVTGNVS